MDEAAKWFANRLPPGEGKTNEGNERIVAMERNEHVSDRKPSSPDRVDHRMSSDSGGIHEFDGFVRAQMARQFQCELNARRELGEIFIDAQFEIECTIEVAKHDSTRDRDLT